MRTLAINGIDIVSKFHVTYAGSDDDGAPIRDLDEIDVPGRNGTITVDNGRWKNKTVKYFCLMDKNVKEDLKSFREYLMSMKGSYFRIEDSDKNDEYRNGRLSDSFDPQRDLNYSTASFVIPTSCYPQRWLKIGETPVTLSAEGTITNPTLEYAKPLITVTGTGVLSVNGTIVTINKNATTITLDCDAEDAYTGVENKNGDIYIDDFPTLQPGVNAIIPADKMTVEITPRWWRL
ncbi:MAG: hypothetical protein LKE48_03200 [Solobacterium sp.]|jgi:phage-related protein|nr:hypothetical protein [Solobacterium sp.]MCH4281511.1 hypothetical protein [Solobacterium sp.]